MENSSPLIHLSGICYSYPGALPVLKDLNLTIYAGQRIGLVAPNGSGKTTLFHVIMGLLKPDKGKIEIFGKEMVQEKNFSEIRQQIGLLFQDSDDQLFCPTVKEDVAFGPLNQGYSKDEAIEITQNTLKTLGLNEYEDRITFKLSGGEKRLVSLATVLAMQPKILLLDEPTTGLDRKTKGRLTEVIQSLSITLVVISHEFDFLSAVAKEVYTLEEGKIETERKVFLHSHEHEHAVDKHPHH
ncbi:MAG: ABC transporter ATP-binding protein [Desulfobacteraceae bacterium]|jgi:cobalt/nickel transport system ATP-binding protein